MKKKKEIQFPITLIIHIQYLYILEARLDRSTCINLLDSRFILDNLARQAEAMIL